MLNTNTSPISAKYVEGLIMSNSQLITPWWSGYICLKQTSLDSNTKQRLCGWSAWTDTDQRWYISCKVIPSSGCRIKEEQIFLSSGCWMRVGANVFDLSVLSSERALFCKKQRANCERRSAKAKRKGQSASPYLWMDVVQVIRSLKTLKWGKLLLLKSKLCKGFLVSQARQRLKGIKEGGIKVSLAFILPSKLSVHVWGGQRRRWCWSSHPTSTKTWRYSDSPNL